MAAETAQPTGIDYADAPEGAKISALWEYPDLVVAIFGIQVTTPDGGARYEASGIQDELMASLQQATPGEGLLATRMLQEATAGGGLLLQYWRSAADLDRFARQIPHMRWWKWLVQNSGDGVSFYHEIYEVARGEAIYERGCIPVGPGAFTSLLPEQAGAGRSRQRLDRFAQTRQARAAGEMAQD